MAETSHDLVVGSKAAETSQDPVAGSKVAMTTQTDNARSLYDAEFPNGHRIVPTSGEGKLCGLNAVVLSAKLQSIKTPPTRKKLQRILSSSEYKAHLLTYSPVTEGVVVSENNFTLDELALLVQHYGDTTKQPLRLAVALGGRSGSHRGSFFFTRGRSGCVPGIYDTDIVAVLQNAKGEGVSFFATPHPHEEEAKLIWIHNDNAENVAEGVLGHWSGLGKATPLRIHGHADPKLLPPDILVRLSKDEDREKGFWVRAQILAEEDNTGKVKKYPFRSDRGEEGISLKLKRQGGELFPHLALEAKIDVELDINGEKAKKTLSMATAKFFLDNPQNFDHAEQVEIDRPVADKKFPERGTIRFSFMSRVGATTQRCDVVEPEWQKEVKKVLSLMLSMRKPGRVELILHYHNSKSLAHLQETLEDFKITRRHNWSPFLFMKKRTSATTYPYHKRRGEVVGAELHNGKPYVPVKLPPVLAYRDTVEMEVRHGSAAIIEWEYARSLFEALGTVEHQAQFQILSKNIVLIQLHLSSVLNVDELIFDENVVLEVSWPPSAPNQDKREKCSAIIQDGYATSTNRRDYITLLVLGDSALKYQYIGSVDLNKAPIINNVRVVAKFESTQLIQDCLNLRNFSKYGGKYHNFFLNQAATLGNRSDPTENCGLSKDEVDKIFADVIKIAALNHGQIEALKACRNLLDMFMLIWGPPGTGKTYTAAAFACFLLQCNIHVLAIAPSNAAANQLFSSIVDMQAKLERGGRTINEFERPLMLNRQTAETAQLYCHGKDEHPEIELDEHQQRRVLSWEQQTAKLVSEIELYTDVQMRRRLRAMEQVEHSATAAVIKLAQTGDVEVYAPWSKANKEEPTVDMAAHLRTYLDKLKKERFADWDAEDKQKFDICFTEVRDHVIRSKHCIALTYASTYGEILKPFADGLSVKGPNVVLILDEQSLTSEVRTILALMAPQCWDRIVGCILLGDHEQLPVLVLSKDFNEFFLQAELCTYERKMKAGFPGKQLYECERLHPKLLEYPSRKKYNGALIATANASNRKFHPEYLKSCKEYLEEDDESKLHLYAVTIKESQSHVSTYSKSRSNLHTAHEIGNFLLKIRRDVKPSAFNLEENVIVIAGHKDQVRTINRLLLKKISEYNSTIEDTFLHFSRSEFPNVSTIDGFMGKQKLIVLWDHVISHAHTSSDVGFLRDDRRVNVACTRAQLQLIKFTRIEMLEEQFFAKPTGRQMDFETQEQVLKEKPYISEYLGELLHKELDVEKVVNISGTKD